MKKAISDNFRKPGGTSTKVCARGRVSRAHDLLSRTRLLARHVIDAVQAAVILTSYPVIVAANSMLQSGSGSRARVAACLTFQKFREMRNQAGPGNLGVLLITDNGSNARMGHALLGQSQDVYARGRRAATGACLRGYPSFAPHKEASKDMLEAEFRLAESSPLRRTPNRGCTWRPSVTHLTLSENESYLMNNAEMTGPHTCNGRSDKV